MPRPPPKLDKVASITPITNTGILTVQYDSIWAALSTNQHSDALACVDDYLDGFVSVLLGGPQEKTKITRPLFTNVDKLFLTNTPEYIHRKDPI